MSPDTSQMRVCREKGIAEMILVVNSSSQAANHLAAGLVEGGLLDTYVRPYVNLDRWWEQRLYRLQGLAPAYTRTFGRRRLPAPLGKAQICEAGVLWDFLMAASITDEAR